MTRVAIAQVAHTSLLRMAALLPSPKNAVYVGGKGSNFMCTFAVLKVCTSSCSRRIFEFAKKLNNRIVSLIFSHFGLCTGACYKPVLLYSWRILLPWSNFDPRTPLYRSRMLTLASCTYLVEIGADNLNRSRFKRVPCFRTEWGVMSDE